MKQFKQLVFPVTLFLTAILYFYPIWKGGFIPFPGHLLVSYFSPWKEEAWVGYPTGVSRKGLLGFDTVRMMGPWRRFITDELKAGKLPTWNPHQFAGAPLLANFQSAIFFPPNLLYLLLPFHIAWTILVISQPILATIGMYLLLKNLFNHPSSIIHHPLVIAFLSFAYGFSAWMSVWIEWNIHGFVYALLPFALLFIRKKKTVPTILTISAIILSGHPQMAIIGLTAAALFAAVNHSFKNFLLSTAVALIITSIQWIPAVRYYQEASREQSSSEFVYEKTLLPWSQISQLIAPNYLGNPATGNFRGTANFVETTAYSGIALLGFALIGLIPFLSFLSSSLINSFKFPYSPLKAQGLYHQLDPVEKFSLSILGLVILLTLPTPVSLLLGRLNIPILSTSVASRWLMLWPLATILLAAAGIDWFMYGSLRNFQSTKGVSQTSTKFHLPAFFIFILITDLWIYALFSPSEFRFVSIRNLLIPSIISGLLLFILLIKHIDTKKIQSLLRVADRQSVMKIFIFILGILSIGELILFGWKTIPYTEKRFIYPETPVLEKLQELSRDGSRFAATDGSVIESNFATYYGLYDLSGYDALYPRRIGELIWAAQNNGQPVTDFSRSTVVTPTNPSSARDNLWNLTGVRWIINKDDLLSEHPGQRSNDLSPGFKLIWEEGKWQIYENLKVFPRAFFTADPQWFGENHGLIENTLSSPPSLTSITPAKITSYLPNKVEIEVNAPKNGYLILTDTFYPGWKAAVNNQEVEILPAFHAFRSVHVSPGKHTLEFNYRSL